MASYGSFLLCASLAFVVGYIDADSELKCQSNAALRGFESDRPFFKRVATPLCYNFGKPVCKGAQVHSSNVAGSSLSAGCPDVAPIIQIAHIGVDRNGNPTSLNVTCCALSDRLLLQGRYTIKGTQRVDCGDKTALRNIALDYPGDNQATTATVTCVGLTPK